MENINEENPYEIYSKTVDRLNITVANIDPTDIDSIIGRLKSVMDTIDLGSLPGRLYLLWVVSCEMLKAYLIWHVSFVSCNQIFMKDNKNF